MKFLSVFFTVLLSVLITNAQIVKPVKWKSRIVSTAEGSKVMFNASILKYWHIFSQTQPHPLTATLFSFNSNPNLKLVGSVKEDKPHKEYDEIAEMDLYTLDGNVNFEQKVINTSNTAQTLTGVIDYGACDTMSCLPPEQYKFSIVIPPSKAGGNTVVDSNQMLSATTSNLPNDSGSINKTADVNNVKDESEIVESSVEKTGKWFLFFQGFLAGLAALLTPCVFPMIPMTVSFFTKKSKTRAQGISNALLYGLFIIVIYVGLGTIVSKVFGFDALNALSTNVYFNIIFFIILVVFALSFLGAFEIVLPASFINKVDAQSDRGGFIGIFFMAFTLALVSFSCTGPLVGTTLVSAAVSGEVIAPIITMFGFGLALALPFGLFAAFPGWLNTLPKSGGWLNSVKVVLGFLELALALKFLSNADLVLQKGYITREIFISCWIAIFGLLTMYLLGIFKTAHDSELKHVGVVRLIFAILSLWFTIYLIPGLTSQAPLKLVTGFLPPDFYAEQPKQAFINNANTPNASGHENKCPNNLPCYHDYDEGLKIAKESGKPLLIDFTGWACVNCRKMESSVWSDAAVDKILRNDVILVSLYVDDKNELPKAEQKTVSIGNEPYEIKTIGNKWSYFQASRYKTNTQPQYILLDHNENMLAMPESYNPSIDNYKNWLTEGINKFNKK